MIIRQATIDDIGALSAMGRAFLSYSPYGKHVAFDEASANETAKRLLEDEHSTILVAEAEGQIVGMVGGLIYPHYFNYESLVGQELFWWVNQEHRKTGVGIKLLNAFEQWVKSMGAHLNFMIALSDEHEQKITALYEMHGYKPAERIFIKGL